MCTSSNFPFCITRTSSGGSNRFRMTPICLLLMVGLSDLVRRMVCSGWFDVTYGARTARPRQRYVKPPLHLPRRNDGFVSNGLLAPVCDDHFNPARQQACEKAF